MRFARVALFAVVTLLALTSYRTLPAQEAGSLARLLEQPRIVRSLPVYPANVLRAAEAPYLLGEREITVYVSRPAPESVIGAPASWQTAPCAAGPLTRREPAPGNPPLFRLARPDYDVHFIAEFDDALACRFVSAFVDLFDRFAASSVRGLAALDSAPSVGGSVSGALVPAAPPPGGPLPTAQAPAPDRPVPAPDRQVPNARAAAPPPQFPAVLDMAR